MDRIQRDICASVREELESLTPEISNQRPAADPKGASLQLKYNIKYLADSPRHADSKFVFILSLTEGEVGKSTSV